MIERGKQAVIDRLGINRVAATADQTVADVRYVRTELQLQSARLARTEDFLDDAGDPAEVRRLTEARIETRLRIFETTQWASHAPLRAEPIVSIVLATRDRADLLDHAIASVTAQTYPRWQLVVVDDGSTDRTAELLERWAADDDRIDTVRTSGVGAAAARNAGIAAANGDWVTFLDDDNTMHPGWLRAIAEFTGRRADVAGFLGAQLRDDLVDPGDVPRLLFDDAPTLAALRMNNSIDLGVLAVRRDHPELHFDDTRRIYIDWEMIVRLFEHQPLVPHPVIASLYSTQARGRISERHDDETLAAIREEFARSTTER